MASEQVMSDAARQTINFKAPSCPTFSGGQVASVQNAGPTQLDAMLHFVNLGHLD